MKKYIKYLKELSKKPYGKAVFFFGFYIIFFIAIGFFYRINGSNTNLNNDSKDNVFKDLYTSNYSFTYKVNLDNTDYVYIGSKNDLNYDFTYNDKKYHQDSIKSYVMEDDYVEVENPIKFNEFLNGYNINEIINSSYRESITTYNNRDIMYNLLISSNTLNKLLNDNDTDYFELPNKVSVLIGKNKNVKKISFNLDSYCRLNKLCDNGLHIDIDYDVK